MTQSRDFGEKAEEMRQALGRYSKEDLIDLMTHILRVYVVDEAAPETPDPGQPTPSDELMKLTFPQLVLHLQMCLEHEDLGRFRVEGHEVYVTIGDAEFALHGPTPTLARPKPEPVVEAPAQDAPQRKEPAAADAPPPSRIAERLSLLDADLHDEDAPAAPVTGEPDFDAESSDDSETTDRPKPEPLGSRARSGGGRGGSLFGGTTDARPHVPIEMSPPKPPPPIAAHAPGDMSASEREEVLEETGSEVKPQEEERPEEPPKLAEGDKEIRTSNRFASLELD